MMCGICEHPVSEGPVQYGGIIEHLTNGKFWSYIGPSHQVCWTNWRQIREERELCPGTFDP